MVCQSNSVQYNFRFSKHIHCCYQTTLANTLALNGCLAQTGLSTPNQIAFVDALIISVVAEYLTCSTQVHCCVYPGVCSVVLHARLFVVSGVADQQQWCVLGLSYFFQCLTAGAESAR